MTSNPQATLELSGTAPLRRWVCLYCHGIAWIHSVCGSNQAREQATGLCYRAVQQTGRSVRRRLCGVCFGDNKMMNALILTFIAVFVVGVAFALWKATSDLKAVVNIDISRDTFEKASSLCEQRGARLISMTAYYDKDVLYCDGLKIIAKKDDKQKMWIGFEEIGAVPDLGISRPSAPPAE